MGKFDAVKSAQLGMPISTARSRLVKQLLFRELRRSGQDKCFKCGISIDDIDHLSIEHKEPWLHVSPDLFWDLDNVEFSHLSCNRPDRPWLAGMATTARFNASHPADRGTQWCWICKRERARSDFTLDRHKKTGLQDICRDCRKSSRSRRVTQVAEGTALERRQSE